VSPPPTIRYALLGLLALRSWTGYELTQQTRRSLRLVWPTSDAGLYREQASLVRSGWADVVEEPAGQRTRKRYTITPAGREALRRWLASEPAPPSMGLEGLVRLWLADCGTPENAAAALRSTADAARATIEQMRPMLQAILDGDDPFPHRTQINVLSAELLTDLLSALESRCRLVAGEVESWDTTEGRGLDDATRARIHRLLATEGGSDPLDADT
jgi:PadR family transcriptional regulator AphA